MSPDALNACFEAIGAVLVWGNVRALLRDRHVAGVNLSVSAFYIAWGCSNLWYYYQLGHWLSLLGDIGILSANAVWLVLALSYGSSVKERELS